MSLSAEIYNRFKESLQLLQDKRIIKNNTEIVDKTGYSKQSVSNYINGRQQLSSAFIDKYCEVFKINTKYILKGIGDILENVGNTNNSIQRNLIPLLSDVYTVGSANVLNNSTSTGEVAEYIDAGDWFPGADAAIRHYNDSMKEYPSGCILALKTIIDLKQGFIFGQDYVIEYGEDWNRVTKKVQKRKDNILMGYSTNEEKYDDGTLIHQPIELIKIHRAWRILGYVVKKESSAGVIKVTGKNN